MIFNPCSHVTKYDGLCIYIIISQIGVGDNWEAFRGNVS